MKWIKIILYIKITLSTSPFRKLQDRISVEDVEEKNFDLVFPLYIYPNKKYKIPISQNERIWAQNEFFWKIFKIKQNKKYKINTDHSSRDNIGVH